MFGACGWYSGGTRMGEGVAGREEHSSRWHAGIDGYHSLEKISELKCGIILF